MIRLTGSVLVVVGFLFSGLASAASFDCSKASSPYEKAVCANPNLSSLDEQLAGAYKDARTKSSDPEGLKREQIDWIKSTRQCGADVGCIEKAYGNRISQLQKSPQSASNTQPKSNGISDVDAYKFHVRCYGSTSLQAVVENQIPNNDGTFLKYKTAYQIAAEDVGKRLGYPNTKVIGDVDRSADIYMQPFLEKNHKNNMSIVQANQKKHEEEIKNCLNELKANRDLGDPVFKVFNSYKK
jgi:uncharacterized protein